jgi:C1A family cysteine protease
MSVKRHALGTIKDKPDTRDYLVTNYITTPVALPTIFSMRGKQTPIKNQGSFGACASFSGCAMKEYYDSIEYGKIIDLSEQWLYGKNKENGGYPGEGEYPRVVVDTLVKFGVCEEIYQPYEERYPAKNAPKPGADTNAAKYKAKEYARVSRDIQAIKTALVQNGPVFISVKVYESFYNTGSNGIVPMPKSSEQFLGGHGMVAVGYDDTRRMLEVKNSWGSFGDKGYLWLSYDFWKTYSLDAWSIVDLVELPWRDWPKEHLDEGFALKKSGIMVGKTDGTFDPWSPVTRRHVGIVAVRLGIIAANPWEKDHTPAKRGFVRENLPMLQFLEERWDETLTRFQLGVLIARYLGSK